MKYPGNIIDFLVLILYPFQHYVIFSEAICLLTKINDSFIMSSFIDYSDHFRMLFMVFQYSIKDTN